MDIEKTSAERGNRYGDFAEHAIIAQALKDAMWMNDGWHRLTPAMKQALEVIQDKVARILNGDPTYADNWHDIIGYARLVEKMLTPLSEHKQCTKAPEVSSELIQELAKMCGLIPSHTTAEWVSTLVRFVRVVLDNNSVQEAFVRANAGLLSVSSAAMTDEQIDAVWSATRETLPQPVSEAFTMRAFARALLAAQPARTVKLATKPHAQD